MHSPQQAAAEILALVQPLAAQSDLQWLDLADAGDRILAMDITGPRDVPAWHNSAMDGYAVRFEDVQGVKSSAPIWLEVIEEIPAGATPQQKVQPGQAARLYTGSMLPQGADTIVIQEQTQRQGKQVKILAAPQNQEYVRHQGSFYQAGTPLLAKGMRLQAPDLAILATVQSAKVPVFRRPQVTILSTGNELAEVGQALEPGQIVDSNRYALAELVVTTGGEIQQLKSVGDRPWDLKLAIQTALQNTDLVISSGGVSVGDYDFVDRILEELGAKIHIRSVAVKPGKPLTVASFPPREGGDRPLLYFGLPGNPVSALVSFWRFVQPALRKMSGLTHSWGPIFVQAITRQDLQGDPRRETYLWGRLHLVNGQYEFEIAPGSHSSGNLINLAQTNGLGVVGCDRPQILASETILVMQVGMAIL
jgi:molybdopterin molybdotransferase